ncbi:MAG: ABC transporter substrate-binding protein [Alcaligenaceae bacterium]|jgi:putative ABC transport system substrate-binding protein|nr:ABC transporter substrate-binding protein [Alcaligenaceae bacterium]
MSSINKKYLGVALGLALGLGAVAPTAVMASDKYVAITSIVEHPALDAFKDGVIEALAQKGFKEGDNLRVKFQTAQGNTGTAAQIARQYVGENPDVIVAIGTPSAQAVVAATKTIPVVFGAITDPIAAQLVKDRGASGTNVTGMSDELPLEASIALIKDALPEAKRVGMVYNPGEVNSKVVVDRLKELMPEHGLTLVEAAAPRTVDVSSAARSLVGKADVIFSTTDNNVIATYESLTKVSLDSKLPLIASDTDSVPRGAIAALGLNYNQLGQQTGDMVARILNGEKPGDIVWETSNDLSVHLNKKMADQIDVTFSDELLKSAEKVIE